MKGHASPPMYRPVILAMMNVLMTVVAPVTQAKAATMRRLRVMRGVNEGERSTPERLATPLSPVPLGAVKDTSATLRRVDQPARYESEPSSRRLRCYCSGIWGARSKSTR